MSDKTFNRVIFLVVLLLTMLAFLGFYSREKGKQKITDSCEKTSFYAIGNKGFAVQIYDCKDIIINK